MNSPKDSSDSDKGGNKLAGLNEFLKNKDFKLSDDNEPDFTAFLSKLAAKRGTTRFDDIPSSDKVSPQKFYKKEAVLDDEGSDDQGDNTQEIKKNTL